jgi:hypothetical protein
MPGLVEACRAVVAVAGDAGLERVRPARHGAGPSSRHAARSSMFASTGSGVYSEARSICARRRTHRR